MLNHRMIAVGVMGLVMGVGCNPSLSDEVDMSASSVTAETNLRGMIKANKFVGRATVYEGMSESGGGCGPTEEILKKETGGRLNFAALNVLNTPGDYGDSLPRPIPASIRGVKGLYKNGRNCGRWIRASIPWKGTKKTAHFLIADSCHDGNNWCRDIPGHVDLSVFEIARSIAGVSYTEEDRDRNKNWPFEWNNPEIDWEFVDAPDYKGSIDVHFVKDAQPYWPTIIISNLRRGIHKVFNKRGDGDWKEARMESDRGQVWVLDSQPSNKYEIRFTDAHNESDGKTYRFELPRSCEKGCKAIATPVDVTVQ